MNPQKTIPSGRGADLKLGVSLFSKKSVQNFEIDFGVSGFPGRKLKWWPCKQGLRHLQVGPQGSWSNLWRIPQYHPWFICHCDTHTMCEIVHLDPNNNTQIRTKRASMCDFHMSAKKNWRFEAISTAVLRNPSTNAAQTRSCWYFLQIWNPYHYFDHLSNSRKELRNSAYWWHQRLTLSTGSTEHITITVDVTCKC